MPQGRAIWSGCLILISAIALSAWLAHAGSPVYTFTDTVVPANESIACDLAHQAGFTHCLVTYDFTQTDGQQ